MRPTLLRASRCGNRPPSWITYPMRRRRAGALRASTPSPSSSTLPWSGATRPSARRRSVDFPHPLAPIKTVVVRGANARSTFRTACVCPKLFETPRSDSTPLAPGKFEHQPSGEGRKRADALGLEHRGERSVDGVKQGGHVHPHEALSRGERLTLADRDQLVPRPAGQADAASGALQAMLEQCGCELDQTLQEQALRTLRVGPKTLPRLVRLPPEGVVEEIHPMEVAPLLPPAFGREHELQPRSPRLGAWPGAPGPAPGQVGRGGQ